MTGELGQFKSKFPAGNYMFKVDNRNTRARILEHISHLVLVFLLLTLSR